MKKQLINYIRAGYPGLFIRTHEEARVQSEILAAAAETKYTPYTWSVTQGLATRDEVLPETQDPVAMLAAVAKLPEKSLVSLFDFHMFLADPSPLLFRQLRETLALAKQSNVILVIVGCTLRIPPELEKEITVIDLKLPDREELRVVMEAIAESAKLHLNGNTEPTLDAASGLTTTEAENAFALSIIETKDITSAVVAREKAATVKKNGILEIIESTNGLDAIGGLDRLKDWVNKRRKAFSKEAREYGLPTPKGMLIIGIPGSGKSLTAKATAQILGVPLLKLDAGRIFGSLVGESERNLRAAIATAEAIAPCVLWIDELEKGFSGSKSSGSTDGGTSARVFGSFLQWMQEKTAPVFVVATANDVSALPPELLRKGRFDEQWFVDLPSPEERKEIWNIQIAKRGRKPAKFNLTSLVAATEGWTGAEIEALVSEALYAAFDAEAEPDTGLCLALAKDTVPLSKMMAQQIDGLRQWAQGRARRASALMARETVSRKLAQ